MRVEELDTPALCVDLDVLEKNISDLQRACNALNIPLRVHTKTHKTPAIAQMQIRAGAIGIVSQKIGEAAAMADAGIEDILIPYNIVGAHKLERLSQLVRESDSTITVAADSSTTVEGLSAQASADGCTFRVLVEMDTGGHRCGTQSTDRRRGPEGLYKLSAYALRLLPRASRSFYQGNVRGARTRGHNRIIAYIYRWPAALLYPSTRWHDDEFARSPIRHARWRSRGRMGSGRTQKEPVTFQFNEDCHGN